MKKTVILVLLCILFFSCENEDPIGTEAAPETASDAAPPAPAVRREAAQKRAVLARSSGWVTGIPGIASNAFPAFGGEYWLEGLETPETGGGEGGRAVFSVHASREPVFFSGGWQRRPGTGNNIVLQRFRGNDLLAALVLEAGPARDSWTVIFEFPGGITGMGLENAGFISLIEAWRSRFLYFASLSKTPAGISLPAVVDF
jgi:hypothetical protein